MKAYKFRLYPNQEQEQRLQATLTTCRYLYNTALAERIDAYKNEGKSLSYYDQNKALPLSKNEYQQAVYSQVLQDVLRRLDKSFKRFYDGLESGKKCGFPRFKPDTRYNSFCYPQSGFKLSPDGKHINLSKIGNLKIKCHRTIEGKIKTCTIVRDVDQWFAILTVEGKATKQRIVDPESMVGVDVGLTTFATLSNGETIANPRHLSKSEKKLARLQRRLSKKKPGSKNRNKQRVKVAKCHRQIRRQREDFLHKTSHHLATTYGTIIFEKLNIKGMMHNRKLAKHIADVSWGQLIELTSYKAESAGGSVITVNPKGTSQKCSGCGEVVKKGLSMRVHSCPSCGLVMDRDLNAALNIVALELRQELSATPVDTV